MVQITLILCAMFLGFISWGQTSYWWPLNVLSLLLPVLWYRSDSRLVAGLVLAGYCLATSRGIPNGAAHYFGTSIVEGGLWWFLACFLWFVTGALLWRKSSQARLIMIPVLLLALIITPAGLAGWAHPLTAAGWLFPGWGYWGVLAVIVIMFFLPLLKYTWIFVVGGMLLLVSFSLNAQSQAQETEGWTGLDTDKENFEFGGRAYETRDLIRNYQNMQFLQDEAVRGGRVVLTPESIAGVWNNAAARSWQAWSERHPGKTVLLGAVYSDKGRLESVIMLIEKGLSKPIYRQRMPLPGVLWKPWESEGYQANIATADSVTVAGKRTAFLICYEALIIWPVLLSMWDEPEVLAVNGSVWWAGESIKNGQRQAVMAWSLLFDVALVEAWNV